MGTRPRSFPAACSRVSSEPEMPAGLLHEGMERLVQIAKLYAVCPLRARHVQCRPFERGLIEANGKSVAAVKIEHRCVVECRIGNDDDRTSAVDRLVQRTSPFAGNERAAALVEARQ